MQGSPGAKSFDLRRAWRLLNAEQRVAAIGAVLLVVSTFGPFSFVEAAEILTALGILLLLKRRTDGYQFHLPFGDGTAIAAAGLWCGLLILIRLFDPQQGYTVPRGVMHRTRAPERTTIVMIEGAGVEPTGD